MDYEKNKQDTYTKAQLERIRGMQNALTYETGCTQHCNGGADCTETKQHCRAVDKSGNVLPAQDEPEEPILPMTWSEKLTLVFLLAVSAGCAVALISLGFGWACQTFFIN